MVKTDSVCRAVGNFEVRVLVTGGSGYLGSHLLNSLGASQHQVLNLDLNQPSVVTARSILTESSDIRHEKKVASIFENFRPEVVIHLAALKSVVDSFSNPAEYSEINTVATENLAKLSEKWGAKKFIFASSAAVYGASAGFLTNENEQTLPLSPYGSSKLAAEKFLSRFIGGSLEISCLRIFNLMGFDRKIPVIFSRTSAGSIQSSIWDSRDGKHPFRIFGTNMKTHDGTSIRDYVHPNEVTKVIIKLIDTQDTSPFLMNVGSGVGTSVLQLLDAADKVLPHPILRVYESDREGEIMAITADINRLKEFMQSSFSEQSADLLDFLLQVR
jgi:UDP-glucose 4-epimerase